MKEETLSEVETLQYLYEEGLVDFTGDGEDLTLHSDTTGKDLLNIFRAGYKKGKKDIAKEILDEIDKWKIRDYPKNSQKDIGWNNAILNVIDFIKQKAGFEELE